jgi:hypothetical protein
MRPEQLDRRSASADDAEVSGLAVGDPDEHLAAHPRIGAGARAVNRLLWSFWLLLLLPFLWLGSDWISLLILSQVFLVAAKLIQPAVARTKAVSSPVSTVLCMQEGEDCAQG